MDSKPETTAADDHDESLLDWFLSLPPAQRLAELDSRVAFFQEVRSSDGGIEPTLDDVLAGGHLLLMTSCGPLDVLGQISQGKRYEDVEDKAPPLVVGELPVRVLGLEALIEEKRALGRPKDRAVADLLAAVLKRSQAQE